MSILIKDMEMPESCLVCPACQGDECWIIEGRPQVPDIINRRARWCPLVSVPMHGRLIDADVLMQTIREHDYPLTAHFNSIDNGMFTDGIQQAVDAAPTIIEANDRK